MYYPAYIAEGEDSVWGNVDDFIEKLESGDYARRYDELIAFYTNFPDEIIRADHIKQPIPGCV